MDKFKDYGTIHPSSAKWETLGLLFSPNVGSDHYKVLKNKMPTHPVQLKCD